MQAAKKRTIAYIAAAFVLTVFLMCIPLYSTAGADKDKSMTLTCVRGEECVEGMNWRIYRAGERSGGDFVLTGAFADYPVDIRDMSVENISGAAQTLTSYAVADGIPVLAEGITGADGTITFDGLESGLYLAVGSRTKQGIYTYVPSPLLLEIDNKEQKFTFDAYPKIVRATLSSEVTSHTVRKVWLDYDNNFEARPTYVTVDLYRDFELFDTVTLNEENNWEHRWISLETDHDWRVVEREIPVDYEVRIEYNETQYLIRNRHIDVMDWGEYTRPVTTGAAIITTTTTTTAGGLTTGDSSSAEGSVTTTESGQSASGTTTTAKSPVTTAKPPANTGSGEKLPQTGQLWWPVIPLSIGGILLIIIGIKLKPKKVKDEK